MEENSYRRLDSVCSPMWTTATMSRMERRKPAGQAWVGGWAGGQAGNVDSLSAVSAQRRRRQDRAVPCMPARSICLCFCPTPTHPAPPPPTHTHTVDVRRNVDGRATHARGPAPRLDPVALHGGDEAQRGVGHRRHRPTKVEAVGKAVDVERGVHRPAAVGGDGWRRRAGAAGGGGGRRGGRLREQGRRGSQVASWGAGGRDRDTNPAPPLKPHLTAAAAPAPATAAAALTWQRWAAL